MADEIDTGRTGLSTTLSTNVFELSRGIVSHRSPESGAFEDEGLQPSAAQLSCQRCVGTLAKPSPEMCRPRSPLGLWAPPPADDEGEGRTQNEHIGTSNDTIRRFAIPT
jgi:hypothetical protein